MSFNTKTYDSTNNNYNTNFDTYIIGNNNIPVNGNLYYNNKFEDGVIIFPGIYTLPAIVRSFLISHFP